MAHNLAAINAALKLGDRFTPPVGTVCTVRWDIRGAKSRVTVTRLLDSQPGFPFDGQFNGVIVSEIWPQHVGHEWTFFPEEIEEVIEVPSDALPFEEWGRRCSTT